MRIRAPTSRWRSASPEPLAEQVVPIVEMESLIQERTGARPGEYGSYFQLNPRVDDIPERFSAVYRNVHLLVMGACVDREAAVCVRKTSCSRPWFRICCSATGR